MAVRGIRVHVLLLHASRPFPLSCPFRVSSTHHTSLLSGSHGGGAVEASRATRRHGSHLLLQNGAPQSRACHCHHYRCRCASFSDGLVVPVCVRVFPCRSG